MSATKNKFQSMEIYRCYQLGNAKKYQKMTGFKFFALVEKMLGIQIKLFF